MRSVLQLTAMENLRNKVVCSQCQEPYSECPKILPGCLHVFCPACLHKLPISFVFQSSEGELGTSCSEESSPLPGPPVILSRSTLLERQKSQEVRNKKDLGALIFSVSCPKCNRYSLLPQSGVDGLQTDYLALSLVDTYTSFEALQSKLPHFTCDQCVRDTPAVSFCANCRKAICEDHAQCHDRWEEFSNHHVILLSSLPSGEECTKNQELAVIKYPAPALRLGELTCPKHFKETSDHHMKYFCSSCTDLVCGNCTVSSHKASEQHHCDQITPKLLSEKRIQTQESSSQISSLLQDLDTLLGNIHSQTLNITKNGEEAKRKIEEVFSEVISTLESRKALLCSEVDNIVNGPLEHLAEGNKKVNAVKDHVMECQNFVQGNLDCEGGLSLLTVANVVSDHIKEMVVDYNELLPEIEVVTPAISVSSNGQDQLCDVVCNFAGVHLLNENSNQVSPHGKTVLFNQLMLKGKNSGSGIGNASKGLSLSDIFSSNIHQPPGYKQMPINANPSSLSPMVINMPKIAGIYVRTVDGVSKPSGIRIDRRNSNLVICDFGSHQLTTVNQNGNEIQRFGEEGDQNGEFLFPQNSVRDAQGRTLVVDSLYRIQIFDRNGKFLKSIGQKGKGQLQFIDPVAITIGPNKKIYVLERQNHRIQILNSNFSFHSFIGKSGRGECEFYLPNDMTICDCEHLYVADSGNHRVQILTLDGSFLHSLGSKGSDPGELCYPSHLCVGNDEICVSEEGNHRVSVFNLKGYFILSFGRKGTGEKEFDRPLGIALDCNRVLYICDSMNNRIQIYK